MNAKIEIEREFKTIVTEINKVKSLVKIYHYHIVRLKNELTERYKFYRQEARTHSEMLYKLNEYNTIKELLKHLEQRLKFLKGQYKTIQAIYEKINNR